MWNKHLQFITLCLLGLSTGEHSIIIGGCKQFPGLSVLRTSILTPTRGEQEKLKINVPWIYAKKLSCIEPGTYITAPKISLVGCFLPCCITCQYGIPDRRAGGACHLADRYCHLLPLKLMRFSWTRSAPACQLLLPTMWKTMWWVIQAWSAPCNLRLGHWNIGLGTPRTDAEETTSALLAWLKERRVRNLQTLWRSF